MLCLVQSFVLCYVDEDLVPFAGHPKTLEKKHTPTFGATYVSEITLKSDQMIKIG